MSVNDKNAERNTTAAKGSAKENQQQQPASAPVIDNDVIKSAEATPNIDNIATKFKQEHLTEFSALMFLLGKKEADERIKELLALMNKNDHAVEEATAVFLDTLMDLKEVEDGIKSKTKVNLKRLSDKTAAAFSDARMNLFYMVGTAVVMVDQKYVPERFDSLLVDSVHDAFSDAQKERKAREETAKLVKVPAFGEIFNDTFTDRANKDPEGYIWLSDIVHFLPRAIQSVRDSLPTVKFNFGW